MPVELASIAHEHDEDSFKPVLALTCLVGATLCGPTHGADRARMQGRSKARIEFAQGLIPVGGLGLAVDLFDTEFSTGGTER